MTGLRIVEDEMDSDSVDINRRRNYLQWKTMNFNDFHIKITSLWDVPDRSGESHDFLLYSLVTCPVGIRRGI